MVFLLRNYRLIVAPRKFEVLKTNIYPRSEASRENMLVLGKSNFQGATSRPIVPRHKHSIVYTISILYFLQTRLFTDKFSWTTTIHPGIFQGGALFKQ